MAKNAKITVHPEFTIGEISPRLFSAFLEPIGTIPLKGKSKEVFVYSLTGLKEDTGENEKTEE